MEYIWCIDLEISSTTLSVNRIPFRTSRWSIIACMGPPFLFFDFVVWYYSRALIDVLSVWVNFMWFITHFFSMPLLGKTLFSPWKRMTDDSKARTIESFFETLVMNIMSRIFGAIVRLTLITVGIGALCLGAIALCIVLIVWIFSPFLLVLSLFYGISLFFV